MLAMCCLGCGSRQVAGTAPAGEAGKVAPDASGPSVAGEASGAGLAAGVAERPVKLEVPSMTAAECVEVKLDGSLMALARAYRSGGDVAVKALASAGDLAMDGNRLRVGVTVLDEARVAGVKARIEELGGEVAVELGNRVFALLPVAALEPLTEGEAVWSMAIPQRIVAPLGRN